MKKYFLLMLSLITSVSASTLTEKNDITQGIVSLSSGQLFYREANPTATETVLFIHGNSASGGAFERQMTDQNFAQRMIAIDLPGHGQSENAQNPEKTYSFGGYGNTLIEFLDSLKLSNVVIVGWSLGGHIAIRPAA